MNMISCSRQHVDDTVRHLQKAGRRRMECVVLWLGRPRSGVTEIAECYRPLQTARADQFRIPPNGMTALQAKLRAERLMVAAQVHSHPREAFHSRADDAWAIVRHEGALSLVVPDFAQQVTAANFMDLTKVYRFSSSAKWCEVTSPALESECLRIR